MTIQKCDQCGTVVNEFEVVLKGYFPNKGGGILLPEKLKAKEFCSPECFLAWIREALKKESR